MVFSGVVNSLDLSLREAASLSSFKQNISKVTFKVPLISKYVLPTCMLLNVCF